MNHPHLLVFINSFTKNFMFLGLTRVDFHQPYTRLMPILFWNRRVYLPSCLAGKYTYLVAWFWKTGKYRELILAIDILLIMQALLVVKGKANKNIRINKNNILCRFAKHKQCYATKAEHKTGKV